MTEQNPYVGPRAFEENESQFFFGRNEEIKILANLVMARRAALFFAQSGAGKSSLLRAGLIPELTRQQKIGRGRWATLHQKMAVWPILSVGRGVPSQMISQPINNLYIFSALLSLLPNDAPNDLAGLTLSQGVARRFALNEAEAEKTPTRLVPDDLSTLIVFDQFEELFTHYPTRWQERTNFFQQVSDTLTDHPAIHVLFTMREDHIAELTPYTYLLPEALRPRFRLERLQEQAALQAIIEPALKAEPSRSFAEGVAEDLVKNLSGTQVGQRTASPDTQFPISNPQSPQQGGYVEPVHLQLVCRQLWEQLPPEREIIRAEDVQEFGDVDQALIGFYEGALQKVLNQTELGLSERRLRAWFGQYLITPAKTRSLVYRGETETEGLPNPAIDSLNNAYIIRADIRSGDTWYELAHDRLVEPIMTANQAWRISYYNPLALAQQAWQEAGRAPDKLLRGPPLAEAQAYAGAHPADVTEAEQQFLEESIRQEAIEREQARQAAARRRNTIIAGVVVIIALSLLTMVAFAQRNIAEEQSHRAATAKVDAEVASTEAIEQKNTAEAAEAKALEQKELAEEQARIALSRQLAVSARSRLDSGDSQQALLLAMAAIQQITETVQADNILRSALYAWRGEDILTSSTGHQKRVFRVAFSPNGQYLASISNDNTARLWQLIGERQVLVLSGHTADLTDLVFSPDAQLLVTASRDGTARVWDVSSGRTRYTWEHGRDVVTLAIAPDGKTVATGGEDNLVWLWDLETGRKVRDEPFQTTGAVQDVVFSPDGRYLVAATANWIAWIWERSTGQEVIQLDEHDDSVVRSVAFSPDGRYLATISGDVVRIWDMSTGTLVDLKQGRHGANIMNLAFSPDSNLLATASQDTTSRLWDLRHLEDKPIILRGHTQTVWGVRFSPDSRHLVTTSWDGTARLWVVNGGTLEVVLAGHKKQLWEPAFSPDGRWLATPDEAGVVRLWRAQTSGEVAAHALQAKLGTALVVTDAKVVVGGDEGNLELWNPSTGKVQHHLVGTVRLSAIAANSEGTRLAIGDVEGQITILDVASGTIETAWGAYDNEVRALLFMPDGLHLASAGADPTIRLWNWHTGQAGIELSAHDNDVNGLTLGPDTTTLISASGDGTVRLWDWQTGDMESAFEANEPLLTVAFNPDKHTLAAGGYAAVHIWDLSKPQATSIYLPHQTPVRSLTFSPSEDRLISGGEDGIIRIWNLATREAINIPAHGSRWVSGLSFTADEKLLLSTGGDGWIRAWPVQTADVLDLGCRRVDHRLSQAEWEEFFPSSIPFIQLCSEMESRQWIESQKLDPPHPLVSPPSLAATVEQPVIYYFEAVPGTSIRPGDSVKLRWDVGNATALYLRYEGKSYGKTAPFEQSFQLDEGTTYQLVVVNQVDTITQTLKISIDQE